MDALKRLRILNTNSLKLLAAALMLVDHLGMIFFPEQLVFRFFGRLSMPIFAFMISEGCRYTKNKLRYFLSVCILGTLCQIVYFIFDPSMLYFGILLTFSVSILLIYALQFAKACLFDEAAPLGKKICAVLLFCLSVAAVATLCAFVQIDYGFWGAITPVFASLFDFRRIPVPDKWRKLDCLPVRVLCMLLPLSLLCVYHILPLFQLPCLLALPVLLLYSGEKGKRNMKYFFYLFYPLHLGVLEGIYMLLYLL